MVPLVCHIWTKKRIRKAIVPILGHHEPDILFLFLDSMKFSVTVQKEKEKKKKKKRTMGPWSAFIIWEIPIYFSTSNWHGKGFSLLRIRNISVPFPSSHCWARTKMFWRIFYHQVFHFSHKSSPIKCIRMVAYKWGYPPKSNWWYLKLKILPHVVKNRKQITRTSFTHCHNFNNQASTLNDKNHLELTETNH